MQCSQTYIEIKHQLNGDIRYYKCLPVHVADDEAIIIYKLTQETLVDDLVIPAGTFSFGYFWMDRHYNIYQWVDETGETIGVYFNVCDKVKISKNTVSWRDLVIDLLVTPDGRCKVLDIHEVPQDIDERLSGLIKYTVKHLKREFHSIIANVQEKTKRYMSKEMIEVLKKCD